MKPAILALADGTVFEGRAFGAEGEATGEVIFNTAMTGYQEILTDPSYRGQMVMMTYPLIGNYGVNEEDIESPRPVLSGFIVREVSPAPSNWRSTRTLEAYLKENRIVGIQGIDTRALTRHLRDKGAMEGIISTEDLTPEHLVGKARSSPGLLGRDLVREVTCPTPYTWTEGEWRWGQREEAEEGMPQAPADQLPLFGPLPAAGARRYRVVAYDCGIKRNILRKLVSVGCEVTVVPAQTSAATCLAMDPDGIFLSNGPGDPEGVPYLIEAVRSLIGKKPIFGICLGHQILGLALGGRTYKLKFGHHGVNHPVKDLTTGKVEITTQNHGFAVDVESLRAAPGGEDNILLTHVNLNDQTCEGLLHRKHPLFSVQYHPEASAGPHDSHYLFDRFVTLMRRERRVSVQAPRIQLDDTPPEPGTGESTPEG